MSQAKIVSHPEALKLVQHWQSDNFKVVFTNGCFDILHLGHIDYLEKAKALGNKLILGLNTDESVKKLKGSTRPINQWHARARMLAALQFVDAVVSFEEDTPLQLIKDLLPDVLVKGKDYDISNKTLANWKTVLHDFWKWIVRREKRKSQLEMVDFPEISFEMEMKTLVSIDVQQEIIEEVKRISWDLNPRIWLGIKLLSLYPRIRPGEMLDVKEGHINLKDNWMVFPHPKEKKPKKHLHGKINK